LVVQIYDATKPFPREELFGLTSQLRRAAISVPSNVAEGLERDTAPDRRNFLTRSRSSIAELETQLEASVMIGYLTEAKLFDILVTTDEVSRMLTSMRRNIRDRP
jgi:four helix bundle protein